MKGTPSGFPLPSTANKTVPRKRIATHRRPPDPLERGVVGNNQMALDKIRARRHRHQPAAIPVSRIQRRLKRPRIVGFPVPDRAESHDVVDAARDRLRRHTKRTGKTDCHQRGEAYPSWFTSPLVHDASPGAMTANGTNGTYRTHRTYGTICFQSLSGVLPTGFVFLCFSLTCKRAWVMRSRRPPSLRKSCSNRCICRSSR